MPYSDPQEQREYLTRYARGWYQRNREKERARQKTWRDANREKLSASRKAFREANKERLAQEQRARRAANPERNLQIWRKSHYKTTYGLTLEQYDAILVSQGWKCAICGATKPGGRWARFCVDHCHATGRVRGLLCLTCNNALGHVEKWYASRKALVDAYIAGNAEVAS